MPERRVRRWPWRLAVMFIVATLIALMVVPWTVNRRIERLRIGVIDALPARGLVMRWHYHMTREIVALSELVLTGNPQSMTDYASAYDDEKAVVQALDPIARRLGGEVFESYWMARRLSQQWHARIDETQLEREVSVAGASLMRIPDERLLIEDVIAGILQVETSLNSLAQGTQSRIAATGRQGMRYSLLLGLLMLVAGAAVITLEQRMRRFAEEAEKRRAEADEALAESARVTEARERLLRGITHDVKNPLGAAKGYAELLEMGVKAPMLPEQKPLVEGVTRSIDYALAIIEDLIEYSHADTGAVKLERKECDLGDIVNDVAKDHDAAIRARDHTLEVSVPKTPLKAHTDPIRLRQVLDNLLSNAIKFTPPHGHIRVRARQSHEDGERPRAWAIIEVSDTGPGIPPEKRDLVFEEFTRLDKSEEGHGLGLAIARGLSRRLGGDLTIADTEVGSKFVVKIPQRDKEVDDEAATHANEEHGEARSGS